LLESSTASPPIPEPEGAAPKPASGETPLAFSPRAQEEFRRLCERYPIPATRVLPALHLAQREFGWIREDVMRLVAETLEIPVASVRSAATFYTMFHTRPVGRLHVQVCLSLPCALRGSRGVYEALREKLGVEPGDVTRDGLFSLAKVECLALCDRAPAVQVNDADHLDVSMARVDEILEECRRNAAQK
jgi:NADH-quinone oxidoreductase E subunit